MKIKDTDIFVRKLKKFYTLYDIPVYGNLDEVKKTTPPTDDVKSRQKYEAQHGEGLEDTEFVYYQENGNSPIDEVELLEYYGTYNVSKDPNKPEMKDVIFTLANRKILIRAEINPLQTKRKKPFFIALNPLLQYSMAPILQ